MFRFPVSPVPGSGLGAGVFDYAVISGHFGHFPVGSGAWVSPLPGPLSQVSGRTKESRFSLRRWYRDIFSLLQSRLKGLGWKARISDFRSVSPIPIRFGSYRHHSQGQSHLYSAAGVIPNLPLLATMCRRRCARLGSQGAFCVPLCAILGT